MQDKISFTSTINFVPHTKYKRISHNCNTYIDTAIYGKNMLFRQALNFKIKAVRTCTALVINDGENNALGAHFYDCLENAQHLNDICTNMSDAINWKPSGGLIVGSKSLMFRPYSKPIFSNLKDYMAEKISKLSVFQEHADELSETDFHYDVKTDTYTICSRGFDRKNEKIISVNSLEDLLKRYRKIHIADGDILMINGEKINPDTLQ